MTAQHTLICCIIDDAWLSHTSLNSRSDVVSYVAKFGVYFRHQNSVFGRNVSFCSEHFSLNANDLICGNVSTQLVHNICLGRITVSSYCNALGVFEL